LILTTLQSFFYVLLPLSAIKNNQKMLQDGALGAAFEIKSWMLPNKNNLPLIGLGLFS